MKQNRLSLLVGLILVVVFGLLLFAFQVRQTEVAVVTTFGKPTRDIPDPGLYGKLPWPIQKVYKFDKRIQNFEEDKFEETLTRDKQNLNIRVYAGWRIIDPRIFLQRFADGSVTEAERNLEGLIRSEKNATVGRHTFSNFISPNENEIKLVEIEREILKAVKDRARINYGIEVAFLGIKKLGLPESITQKVFERMQAERNRLVQKYKGQGDSESMLIRAKADGERDTILANAESAATRIKGEADAEASKYYSVYEQAPELASFYLGLNALEQALKEGSSLILDPRTPPFDLLISRTLEGTIKPPNLPLSGPDTNGIGSIAERNGQRR
jgi:membrane protease subunit HflC